MKAVFAVLLGLMISAAPAFAQETADESESGLSVPRMVSLRSNLINARSGPGRALSDRVGLYAERRAGGNYRRV